MFGRMLTKMGGHTHRFKIYASISAAALAWITDSAIDSFIFHEDNFLSSLLQPDMHEIYVRSIWACMVATSVYAGIIISELRVAQHILRDERDTTQRYLDIVSAIVVVLRSDGTVFLINQKGIDILGYEESEIIGRNWFDVFVPASINKDAGGSFQGLVAGQSTQSEYYEGLVLTKAGEEKLIAWRSMVIRDEEGSMVSVLSSGENITERKETEGHIRFLAYYDGLTGLPNRTLFKEIMNKALAYAERYHQLGALLYLDLDDFKRINDSLGHDAGDALLQSVSERMSKSVRKSDSIARFAEDDDSVVSRLGGDEFVVLLQNVHDLVGVNKAVHRIQKTLEKPFELKGHKVFVSSSIGICLFPSGESNIENLLKNADTAMYHAKAQGKNNCQFYSEDMNIAAMDMLTMESDLHRAIEQEEFLLHYQPKFNASTRKAVGVEALLRWNHKEKGIISPAQFIPLAERTGLIVQIGERVLFYACSQGSAWLKTGFKNARVAVNLSARQFSQKNLLGVIQRTLESTEFPPQYLELEITESVAMKYPEDTIAILKSIKDMGVQISIDDFGTGYSSLSYLRKLPIDILKIDRSFVMNINLNQADNAIVEGIIALAHSLKLKVIAEGVETEAQFDLLCGLGCDEVQGYLFSKPLPAEEITRFLSAEEN